MCTYSHISLHYVCVCVCEIVIMITPNNLWITLPCIHVSLLLLWTKGEFHFFLFFDCRLLLWLDLTNGIWQKWHWMSSEARLIETRELLLLVSCYPEIPMLWTIMLTKKDLLQRKAQVSSVLVNYQLTIPRQDQKRIPQPTYRIMTNNKLWLFKTMKF